MNEQSPHADLPYPKFRKHFNEFIGIGDNGHLWVEGRDVVALAETYGTPLYVISENQIRHSYRRFRDAWASRYPDVEVMYANKANNGLAVRHILNHEGAGGDAFGVNEMTLALMTGADPKKTVLNGSNKGPGEIEIAILNGICINIDAMGELDLIDAESRRLGRDAEVGIRVKLELKRLENRFATEMHGPGSLAEQGRNHKWGMPYAQTVELVKRIQAMEHLHLKELSYHLSRMDNRTDDFAVMAHEMVEWSAMLRDDTGWTPPYLDLGGGWSFGRPEKTGPGGEDDENTPTYEEYAEAVCDAVREACTEFDLPLPGLRFECGRGLVGGAVIAIGRVGATKEWPEYGKRWVNVDLSENHLHPVLETWHYHMVVANKPDAPVEQVTDVVGPLCSPDLLAKARELPLLDAGDLIAFLDVGAYTESRAANFNALLRPATVMVCGSDADVTTERERFSDVVGRYRVPPRLLARSLAGQE